MVWESRADAQFESPFEPRKQNFMPLPLGVAILTPSHSTHPRNLCLSTRTNGNELLYALSQTRLVGVGVGQGNAPVVRRRYLPFYIYIFMMGPEEAPLFRSGLIRRKTMTRFGVL